MNDEAYIRRAYELARSAAENGNQPFGALLVHDGKVIHEAENTINTDRDPTRHAELNLVSEAARKFPLKVLSEAVLYTSTEPCAMCAGGIYWTGVRKIVFGCSSKSLGEIAGGSLLIPSNTILIHGHAPTEIIGPILEAEGIEIHKGYW